MRVIIRNEEDGSIYKDLHAVRVATRKSPSIADVTEIIVYSGGHSYSFPTTVYYVEIIEG